MLRYLTLGFVIWAIVFDVIWVFAGRPISASSLMLSDFLLLCYALLDAMESEV